MAEKDKMIVMCIIYTTKRNRNFKGSGYDTLQFMGGYYEQSKLQSTFTDWRIFGALLGVGYCI